MELDPHDPAYRSPLSHLAAALQVTGRLEEAVPFHHRTVEINREHLTPLHPRTGRSILSLASAIAALDRYQEAESLMVEACAIYEHSRSGWERDVRRSELLSSVNAQRVLFRSSPHAQLALLQLRAGHREAAWLSAERHTARGLADVILDVSVISYDDKLLRTVQSALEPDEAIIGWVEPYARYAARQVVPHEHPGGASWVYCVPHRGPVRWVQLPTLHASENLALLDGTVAQLRSPPAVRVGAIDSTSAELMRAKLAPLLPHLVDVERLIVVPSGPMHGLPVGHLVDAASGTRLCDRFAISYVPSCRIFAWLRTKDPARPSPEWESAGRCLAIADPPFCNRHADDMRAGISRECASAAGDEEDPHNLLAGLFRDAAGAQADLTQLRRLPCTRREAESVVAHHDPESHLLIGEAADERALHDLFVSGELGSLRTLHFATHSLLDFDRAEESVLVLSQTALPHPKDALLEDGTILDGRLSADEIASWSLNAELVTLSACNTALGRQAGGEGHVGLAWSFLSAGARSVIVSLWPVHDESTSLLMHRFYENWLGSREREGIEQAQMTKRRAMQEAKSWLRDDAEDGRFADPYYWAGFILVGDPD
jgi:CHAT domain-containing protein